MNDEDFEYLDQQTRNQLGANLAELLAQRHAAPDNQAYRKLVTAAILAAIGDMLDSVDALWKSGGIEEELRTKQEEWKRRVAGVIDSLSGGR